MIKMIQLAFHPKNIKQCTKKGCTVHFLYHSCHEGGGGNNIQTAEEERGGGGWAGGVVELKEKPSTGYEHMLSRRGRCAAAEVGRRGATLAL